jgi:hypothetical protein
VNLRVRGKVDFKRLTAKGFPSGSGGEVHKFGCAMDMDFERGVTGILRRAYIARGAGENAHLERGEASETQTTGRTVCTYRARRVEARIVRQRKQEKTGKGTGRG